MGSELHRMAKKEASVGAEKPRHRHRNSKREVCPRGDILFLRCWREANVASCVCVRACGVWSVLQQQPSQFLPSSLGNTQAARAGPQGRRIK